MLGWRIALPFEQRQVRGVDVELPAERAALLYVREASGARAGPRPPSRHPLALMRGSLLRPQEWGRPRRGRRGTSFFTALSD